jgi:hypothetical protein
MSMLTPEQREQFAEALTDFGWFSDAADAIDDIVETRDTMADFIEVADQPFKTLTFTAHHVAKNGVVLNIWLGIQRAPDHPRHDLAVADFGDARAAYLGCCQRAAWRILDEWRQT